MSGRRAGLRGRSRLGRLSLCFGGFSLRLGNFKFGSLNLGIELQYFHVIISPTANDTYREQE